MKREQRKAWAKEKRLWQKKKFEEKKALARKWAAVPPPSRFQRVVRFVRRMLLGRP